MKTLPLSCSDDDIKALVAEWFELLAAERYQEAIDLFLHWDEECSWTAELLRKTVEGYGVPDLDPQTVALLHEEWNVARFRMASLEQRPDKERIIKVSIVVNRQNLYGLDPERYVGMVHFFDVPLDAGISDLTARFHIRRVGEDQLTLEFLDLHTL